jgi:hypothetical protein
MYHQCQPMGRGQHEQLDHDMTTGRTMDFPMPQATSLDGAIRLAGASRP